MDILGLAPTRVAPLMAVVPSSPCQPLLVNTPTGLTQSQSLEPSSLVFLAYRY